VNTHFHPYLRGFHVLVAADGVVAVIAALMIVK